MKTISNNNGLTIKELKEFVKELPEVDDCGDEHELYIRDFERPWFSSIIKSAIKLNTGDICFSIEQAN